MSSLLARIEKLEARNLKLEPPTIIWTIIDMERRIIGGYRRVAGGELAPLTEEELAGIRAEASVTR